MIRSMIKTVSGNFIRGMVRGLITVTSALKFDPLQSSNFGSGGDVIITDTTITGTASIVAGSTNGSFGDTTDRFGVYFKIPTLLDVLNTQTANFDMILASGDANLSIGVLPSFISTGTVSVLNTDGVFTITLTRVGQIVGGDVTNPNLSLSADGNTEFCIAFDSDASANGTAYFYIQTTANTPIASHEFTTVDHAPVSQMAAGIIGNTGATLTIELVRNPSVAHAGVRNVGA